MISEKTHIPEQMSPFQIGWFIVAINLSDIAAKGGSPLGVVLSFGLPKNTTELFLTELTKGADACATKFGTYIIGGDTKETGEIKRVVSSLLLQMDRLPSHRAGALPPGEMPLDRGISSLCHCFGCCPGRVCACRG